jgi:hypothetical protein
LFGLARPIDAARQPGNFALSLAPKPGNKIEMAKNRAAHNSINPMTSISAAERLQALENLLYMFDNQGMLWGGIVINDRAFIYHLARICENDCNYLFLR